LYADGGNGSRPAKNDLHLGKLQGMFRAARNVLRCAKPLPLQGAETISEVGGFEGGVAKSSPRYRAPKSHGTEYDFIVITPMGNNVETDFQRAGRLQFRHNL
jgi:hypothetical protein